MINKGNQELHSQLKTIKTIVGALIGVLTVLFAVTIYGIVTFENKTTFIALLVVGVSIAALLPLQFKTIKKIKEGLSTEN